MIKNIFCSLVFSLLIHFLLYGIAVETLFFLKYGMVGVCTQTLLAYLCNPRLLKNYIINHIYEKHHHKIIRDSKKRKKILKAL